MTKDSPKPRNSEVHHSDSENDNQLSKKGQKSLNTKEIQLITEGMPKSLNKTRYAETQDFLSNLENQRGGILGEKKSVPSEMLHEDTIDKNLRPERKPKIRQEYDYPALQKDLRAYLKKTPNELPNNKIRDLAKGLRQQARGDMQRGLIDPYLAEQLDQTQRDMLQATIQDYEKQYEKINATYKKQLYIEAEKFGNENRVFAGEEIRLLLQNVSDFQSVTSDYAQTVLDTQRSLKQPLDQKLADFVEQVTGKRQYDYRDLQERLKGYLDTPPETLPKDEVVFLVGGLRQQMREMDRLVKTVASQLPSDTNNYGIDLEGYTREAQRLNGVYNQAIASEFRNQEYTSFGREKIKEILNHVKDAQQVILKPAWSILKAQWSLKQKLDQKLSAFIEQIEMPNINKFKMVDINNPSHKETLKAISTEQLLNEIRFPLPGQVDAGYTLKIGDKWPVDTLNQFAFLLSQGEAAFPSSKNTKDYMEEYNMAFNENEAIYIVEQCLKWYDFLPSSEDRQSLKLNTRTYIRGYKDSAIEERKTAKKEKEDKKPESEKLSYIRSKTTKNSKNEAKNKINAIRAHLDKNISDSGTLITEELKENIVKRQIEAMERSLDLLSLGTEDKMQKAFFELSRIGYNDLVQLREESRKAANNERKSLEKKPKDASNQENINLEILKKIQLVQDWMNPGSSERATTFTREVRATLRATSIDKVAETWISVKDSIEDNDFLGYNLQSTLRRLKRNLRSDEEDALREDK